MSDRIKFKDSQWKTGVEIPDGLITPSATNIYKLLEALNIDWQNCTVPNATRITKWNGANIDPKQKIDGDFIKFNEYKEKILQDSNLNTENENNHIDWIYSNYDYLSENIDPSTIENEYVKNLLPRWHKDGTIKDSIDVVDILNYLLWRVSVIDYYTDHWDSRNGQATEFKPIIYWDENSTIEPLENVTRSEVGIDVGGYYDFSSLIDYNNTIILKPKEERNNIKLNQINNDIYNYYENNNEENYIHTVLATNNPSSEFYVSVNVNEDEPNIISFTSENIIYLDTVGIVDNKWYLFKLDANIIGTGNYHSINEWYSNIIRNPNFSENKYNIFNYFDPYEIGPINLKITQNQGHYGNDTFVEKEGTIMLHIQKTYNYVKSFKFGSTEEAIDIIAYKDNINIKESNLNDEGGFNDYFTNNLDIKYYLLENDLNFDQQTKTIGNIFTFEGIKDNQGNTKNISIPYYIDESSKYELKFDLKYSKEYGIYPYFFLSGDENSFELDENNLFEKYVSGNNPEDDNDNSDGRIIKENDKYYYIPPFEQPNADENKIITICCIFYYPDDDKPRQIAPTLVTFKLKLNKEITNSVYFRNENYENFICYNQEFDSFTSTRIAGGTGVKNNISNDNHDPFVNFGNSYFNKGESNISNSNNVSYCFRTIYYNELFNYTDSEDKVKLTRDIFLDDCILTNCRTEQYKPEDFNIQYLGYISSDTSSRTIYFAENEDPNESEKYDLTNSYVNINNYSDNPYKLKIDHQLNLKVGEENDKTFYYCDKTPEIWQSYYTANKGFINSLNIEPKPETDGDIVIDYKPNAEILTPGDDILNYNYEIHEDTNNEFCTFGEGTGDRKFVISIKKSTAIYDDKNGIFNDKENGGTDENPNWVNADRDYYYLVFRIEVKGGQIGSYSYTPCKAYYFLKVLRNTTQTIGSSTESPGKEYITYYIDEEDNNQLKMRRFKMVPRIPIYLNRLFSSETQNILMSSNPKIYWEFYGIGQSNVAQLQESNLCISHNGEEYIKLYNEEDTCPFKEYIKGSHINANYDFYPERNKTIGEGGTNEIIQKFSNNNSGAILYVNKLVKKTIDEHGNDLIIPIDQENIEIPLMYAIGNSAKYARFINNTSAFFVYIYKKDLDIDIVENININALVETRLTKSITDYSMLSKLIYKQEGYAIIDAVNYPTVVVDSSGQYDVRWQIHIVSTEFGNDTNIQYYIADALQIIQDPETGLNILNIPGYNFKIDIDSENINNNWYIDDNRQIDILADPNPINIYYFKYYDTSQSTDKYGLNIFGLKSNQGTIKLMFRITGDDDGIYNTKIIQTLVRVIDIPEQEPEGPGE